MTEEKSTEESTHTGKPEQDGKETTPWAGGACCSGPMKEQMMGMMERIRAAENPMALCEQMKSMCEDMMQEMKGKCCS